MDQYIIKCKSLTKKYKGNTVVDKADLHIKKGEIYGIVGPNGAGKSTILKMLLNLVHRDDGQIFWNGNPITSDDYLYLGRIGSLIENPYFYEKLSGMDNLLLHLEYLGIPDKKIAEEAMKMVSLPIDYKKKTSEYSLGMKQRLAIARAILPKPDLLIMDEPINGLDPQGIVDIRNLFQKLNRDFGISIIITSHILSEVEQLADTVGFLQDGKVLQEIAMKDILEKSAAYVEITVDNINQAAGILVEDLHLQNFKVLSDNLIRIYDTAADMKTINRILTLKNVGVESIRKKENNLENYFFTIESEGALS